MSDTKNKTNGLTPLISQNAIKKRVSEIADEISNDFRGQSIILICVLKGAVFFMSDLARELTIDTDIDFIGVSSYGDGTVSTNEIKLTFDCKACVEGKNIILVEDIIDSGHTLEYLSDYFLKQCPKSFKICVLLDKQGKNRSASVMIDYTGFVVPDKFVVGYGMDYARLYRNLHEIYELKIN